MSGMFKTSLLLILFCFPIVLFAQHGPAISGRITAFDGQPIELVSISIVELKKGTLTDNNGNYSIEEIAPGTYTLRIQLLGAPQKDFKIEVVPGRPAILDYQLPKENIQALQEVRIIGNTNKFSKKESYYVSRLPLKNLENPQVYNVVPKELIEEQMAIDLGSISKNVPGAGLPMIANQGRVTFRQRGFETEPNARNGVAGAAFATLDPVNLERVEAIKGPSATLFGTNISSSYGGLYNRVTKKPFNGFGGEVAFTGGSWNYNRLTVDVNTPVNKEKTMLFRLNGATTFQKSFQDMGFTNNLSLAPSFSYQITDRLSLLLDVEFGQEKGTSVVRFNPYTGGGKTLSIADMKFPYKRLFLSNDLAYQTQMMNIFAQINYKISEHWTSQTVVSRARSSINGYINALNGRTDSTLRASVINGYTTFIATDIQQNFIGDFNIGKFRNRMVIGLDYYNNSNSFDRTTVAGPTINFQHPGASYRLGKSTIDSLVARATGTAIRNENNGDNSYAAYASDVFNITKNLMAMVSLRVDYYRAQGTHSIIYDTTAAGTNYHQTALSPKLGLVYEVLKDKVSVFGSYMNGFFHETGTDYEGNAFKPEEGNQLEGGVKVDVWQHKLVGTLSCYDIRVKNVVIADLEHNGYSKQNGTQRSKGLEAEITVNPVRGLNIVAGYAYNDSKYTKSDSATLGLRPALSGPPNMWNFWASYHISSGNLNGLGFGFGGNGGDQSYQTNTATTKITIPSYVMLDASVFYERSKYRIGVKIDNLTSQKAWSVRLTPQPPTRVLGSFALKF
ncbi:TonB-dependent receptor [Chitinophaga sancti]|uniref:Iron complex outermembrane recepter protein n=1 Tax=Chitinophaga sancti TaxID=1004 RepID=A0A1K1MN30_9BACT|nr:TonB-dependent receptor [Chitinophaga sancti]WQD62828.1 TonB-dependent receptor [Chitinophaga sancti]WQG91548.1 TonB-dependent receptor [Chitinophaga sancti]SFW24560.1 iron complex outermembrane recepter protein [Chitinophaga sancti]